MKKITSLTLQTFILLLCIWICIAIGRLFFYSKQSIVDFAMWSHLDASEKEKRLYGTVFREEQQITSLTPAFTKILFVSHNGWKFFLLRYLLYPRKLVWSDEHVEKDYYHFVVVDKEMGELQSFVSSDARIIKL